MSKTRISAFVALDEKRGIGKNNDLLFRIPEDFKRMKTLTTGHPIIMGRKTYESIGRILPNRTNIIITREVDSFVKSNPKLNSSIRHSRPDRESVDPRFHEDDTKAIIVTSLEEALKEAKNSPGADEIFIFGGGQIFQQALSITDRLYITLVEGDYGADTFFPDYSKFKKVVSEEKKESDGYQYRFLVLER